MAITEAKVISQVTILPTANTINVQWANQINKENVVIAETDRKSTRLNSSHIPLSRMPSSA